MNQKTITEKIEDGFAKLSEVELKIIASRESALRQTITIYLRDVSLPAAATSNEDSGVSAL